VPLVIVAAILLCFVKEKPLATTIERDILPESLEIDGASSVAATTASIPVVDSANRADSAYKANRANGADSDKTDVAAPATRTGRA